MEEAIIKGYGGKYTITEEGELQFCAILIGVLFGILLALSN